MTASANDRGPSSSVSLDDAAVSLVGRSSPGLSLVTGQAPAAVLLVDLTAREIVYANPVAVELAPGVHLPAGLDAWSDAAELRDVDGDELSDTDHPLSVVARSEPVLGQAVSAARATSMGRRREPLWVVALPMVDAPRLEDHALVVFLPLSDRENAQAAAQAARESADLREQAVLATGLSFTVADARAADVPLVWVNPAFTATTGYSFAESVGRNCRFLQGPATDPAALVTIRSSLDTGTSITITLLNYRKDGTAFWNQLSMSPIYGPDGALTHFVGIQSDVTGRVAADAERDRALAAERAARREAEQARQEAEEARRRVAVMAEATSQLAATLDVAECRERLLKLAIPALADWGMIVTTGPGGRVEDVSANHADEHRHHELERLRQGVAASLPRLPPLPASALRIINDDNPQWRRQWARWLTLPGVLDLADPLESASIVVVPLPGRGEVRDVMILVRGPDRSTHTDDDLVLATDLGRRAGLILDNARLYQAQHRIAEALQRSLLPALPVIGGVTSAARYSPGESGAEVGGDFYELIALPGGAVGFAIGDIVGHDVMAAAAMGHLRGLLRACAWDGDRPTPATDRRRPAVQDPADVLSRVDQLIAGLGISILATLNYGRLHRSPDDGWTLRCASAGHPPLMLRYPDGSVDVLGNSGDLLLGVQSSRRVTHQHHVPNGALLLAYTDGLIERRGEDLDHGLTRLTRALSTGPGPVEELCDHLLSELGDSHDDVAILALQL